MEEAEIETVVHEASSTQVGAIGECLAAAGILQASGGRLAPFRPVADDDGLDLLLLDKLTRKPIPLQIKCRRKFDNPQAQTLQFDVRLATFRTDGPGYVLCMKLEGVGVSTMWLIPSSDLEGVGRPTPPPPGTPLTLRLTPSAKGTHRERYTPYRVTSFDEVVERILASDHT